MAGPVERCDLAQRVGFKPGVGAAVACVGDREGPGVLPRRDRGGTDGAADPLPHDVLLLRDVADRALPPHEAGDGLPGWVVAGAWNNALALVVTGILAVAGTWRYTGWSPCRAAGL